MTQAQNPHNRSCTLQNLRGRSLNQIKQSILRHEGVSDRFTLPATPAPARDQTLFQAYRDGDELLIAVAVVESAAPTMRHGTVPVTNRNNIELLFAPWDDELGWVQFCFPPEGAPQTFNHAPYAEAASTAFSVPQLKRHLWETETNAASPTHRLYWLFAWFSISDMFRAGNACGFNIVRYMPPLEEWSSWNHACAVGFQDATTFGKLHLRKPRGTQASPEIPRVSPTPTRDFRISVTYDIPDNLGMTNGYTPQRLDREMALWKSYGVERIYWIEYGPLSQWPSLFTPEFYGVTGAKRDALIRNMAITTRTCDDTLHWAVKSAKRHGMEIYAVYKPFDLGFNFSTTADDGFSCVKEIEDRFVVAHPDVAANQASTMSAHPDWLRTPTFPITRLCLWSQNPIEAFDASRLILWTSKDNRRFTRHKAGFKVKVSTKKRPHARWTPAGKVAEPGSCKNGCIEISGLNINAPFLAIEIAGKRFSLSHRMFAFAEAWGKGGDPAPIELSSQGNREKGYMFNKTWLGWANHTEPILDNYTWVGPEMCLRFGDAPTITTLLEPTYEASRQVWLSHVERILESGVDGIDIRTIGHHSGTESYLKFAFAQPVREEFRRRIGRDVQPIEEDYQVIRRIRGDAYTQFLIQAGALARGRGQKLAAHIEWGTEVPSTLSIRLQMQIDLQWKRWISEGVVDEVSLHGWGASNRHVLANILPLAQRHQVGVHVISTNLAGGMDLRAMELAPRLVKEARDAGFSGYSFYETDSLMRMNSQDYPMPVGLFDQALIAARAALDVT
jgi:hypothetical protein